MSPVQKRASAMLTSIPLDIRLSTALLQHPPISTGDAMEHWLDFSLQRDPDLILENHRIYADMLEAAQRYVACGDHAMAAAYGEMATVYAMAHHPGLFVSSELEELLDTIGRAAVALPPPARRLSTSGEVRRVLHVCQNARPVGGLSRFVWRWIEQDSSRHHSLALTRQTWREVPERMRSAVQLSGGRIDFVNSAPGGFLTWCRRLAELARSADLVLVHNGDALPKVALSQVRQHVPVVYVDHGDHAFCVGACTSTVVAGLRRSGMRLARMRRLVEPERQVLLPTLVEAAPRTLGGVEARRRLGLPEDAVILLSIARREKYLTINNVSFADAHVELLLRHPNAVLVVVGAGSRDDWGDAIERTGKRIIPLAERDDTPDFYQAADIYVDSFPFVSITSLLEAGITGLPLVTLFPHSDASAIIGADMPGLDGTLIRAHDYGNYVSHLSALIGDAAYRQQLGAATREHILRHHTGTAWQESLEALYRRALALTPAEAPPARREAPLLAEPDLLVPLAAGQGPGRDAVLQWCLRLMSPAPRLRHWWRLLRQHRGSARSAIGLGKLLLPEWLILSLRYRKSGFSRTQNR